MLPRRLILPGLVFLLLIVGCSEETPTLQDKAAQLAHDFSFPNLDGELRSLKDWQGKVIILNFWAPWCPPCRKEIPAFVELQDKYADKGFTIVGITVDTLTNAQVFADTMGANYPILIAEDKGIDLAKQYGNRVGILPYSVIIDRKGKVVYHHRSELTKEQAEKALAGLL